MPQTNQKAQASTAIAGKELSLTTGELAQQAGGAVVARFGDTVVLATATMGRPFNPDADFMPLLVDYEEKFYAAGKIKGSRFIKREGRPTDDAILNARLIDRAIRPLFPDGMINDLQIVITILSYDGENDPDVLALTAACAALAVSDVPWQGPLAAVRVGKVADRFIINPTVKERETSTLDVIVAGTADRITMIEAGAKEVPEEVLLDALAAAQQALGTITPLLDQLSREAGKPKQPPTFFAADPDMITKVKGLALPLLSDKLAATKSKDDIGQAESDVVAAIITQLQNATTPIPERLIRSTVHESHGEYQRERILTDSQRADGRALDAIRPLSIAVGVLPRTHGSGLFQRGETQILTTVTLGGPSDVLLLDTMEIEAKKRYIHYYNFPAFSVGEIKPSRGPGRREIGHGALAERALIPVLPEQDNWPYTMLLVSEVLGSHGSSSMASVCGSTLALMDAGVPITKPVAGIAMGLITAQDSSGTITNFKILTDIAGLEDEKGDMDFKIAGTHEGITALQMDIKVTGLNREILAQALAQARAARLYLLDEMAKIIAQPRPELSPYAPRIEIMRIPIEKIGDLIGPKGKHINEIIAQTGVDIDIEDDGLVSITSNDAAAMAKAKDWVRNMTREIKTGERFDGKVTRLMDFGAFVELVPGVEGLVHISEFRDERVPSIYDVAKVGDILPVIVVEIDRMGRINLSHKAALPGYSSHSSRPGGNGRRDNGPFRGPRPPSRGHSPLRRGDGPPSRSRR
ncbi:MAG: polyribonucleotide nucleotidyltransferase [Candidatus Andersenbacteria bacterium]|nr:polyribonucleotide nucleotidyltransferase [Candidatus Andersenbacteria bacterium]